MTDNKSTESQHSAWRDAIVLGMTPDTSEGSGGATEASEDAEQEPELEATAEDEAEDEEQTQEETEVTSEDDTEDEDEADAETEDEEAEEEPGGRVWSLRVDHEDVEFDIEADEDKTREVLQKGLAFDRKAGMKTLVARGEVEWDPKQEDYRISEQTQQQLAQKGALALLGQFEKAGLPIRNAAGQYDVTGLLELVNSQNGHEPEEDKAAEAAKEAYLADPQSVDKLQAWIKAEGKAEAQRLTAGRDKQVQEKTKAQQAQATLAKQIQDAKDYVRKQAEKHKTKFTDPISGQVDEDLYQMVLDHADMIIDTKRDWKAALAHVEEKAKKTYQKNKGRIDKRKAQAKKKKAAPKAKAKKSSPSTGSEKRTGGPFNLKAATEAIVAAMESRG